MTRNEPLDDNTLGLAFPDRITTQSVTDWLKEQLDAGVPGEILSRRLLAHQPEPYSLEAMQVLRGAWEEFFGDMVDHNLKGIELEKAGRVDDALLLYEANVAMGFGGSHPYDRLRVIYSKRGQLDDAIRVCQAFVKLAETLIGSGLPYADLPSKRDRFMQWIRKLEARRVKAAEP